MSEIQVGQQVQCNHYLNKSRGMSHPACLPDGVETNNNETVNKESPGLFSFIKESLNKIFSPFYYIYEFILECFESQEEEQEEEEEKQKEKLCEERCEKKKLIEQNCYLHKIKCKQADGYYKYMESLNVRIRQFFRMKDRKRVQYKCFDKGNNYVEEELLEFIGMYKNAKDMYRTQKMNEDFYKSNEEEIVKSLPPFYVCENSFFDLELDLYC